MRKLFLALLIFVNIDCFSQFFISGSVWYDDNYNQFYDFNEKPLSNKLIKIKQAASSFVYDVQTNDDGYYSQEVGEGDYIVYFNGSYDSVNYRPADSILISYSSNFYEYADFGFLPKAPLPTFVGTSMYRYSVQNIPASGSSQTYTIQYGFTDSSILSMPAKLILDFSPLLSITGYSTAPSLVSPGHVEWNLANVQAAEDYPLSNYGDTISCTINFPPVGDTISGFLMKPRFVPGVFVNRIDSSSLATVYEHVVHPNPTPKGTTSGLKWLYKFNRSSDVFYDEGSRGIDTAYADDGYFIAGFKHPFDSSSNSYNPHLSISKINKDGLPFWVKDIRNGLLSNGKDHDATVVLKSLSDGGCAAFGNLNDTSSSGGLAVLKFDASGNVVFAKASGGGPKDYIYDAAVTTDNGFLLTGYSLKDYSVPPGIDSIEKANLFIAKLSSSGDLVWRKEYGGSEDDGGFKIVNLKNGSFLILGATTSTDGDVHGAHQHGILEIYQGDTVYNAEGWVLNVDASGNIIWDKCFGGSGYGYFADAVESAGGILLSGFTSSKDGDLPYYPELGVPLWLLQISNSGAINWSKLYKFHPAYKQTEYVESPVYAEDGPFFVSISPAKDGNFILAGSIQDDYGTIRSKHGESDFCFLKINPQGNIIWQKAVGGTKDDYLNSSILDKNDDLVFLGSSSSVDDDLFESSGNSSYGSVIGKIGITNIIKGQVYIDKNNNNTKDAAEPFYSEGKLISSKIRDTVISYIFNGQFLANVDTGNYVIVYKPASTYYTVTPALHNTSFTTLDQTDVVNFALKPKPNVNDLEVQLIPVTPARPGFETWYRIITKNVGTTTLNTAVTSLKKDSRQTYSSSSKTLSGSAGDSLWWGPVTLNAFDVDTVDVILENQVPPLLNNGDTLTLTATASPIVNDSSLSNNIMILKQGVTGSFDPNDKTEIHGGQFSPLAYSNGEYLQYLIRFQNTGSDTAFFVTVKDTLDTRFDLTTLDVISASHQYNFRIEKNIGTWDFKFIKLVDSITNEPASHGYILFRVKPKKGLAVGDVFNNSAAIYFDYNLPVITNTERTYISDGNGICPGGNIKYTSSVAGSSYQWQVNTGSGYVNVNNTGVYSGATTAALQLTAAPSSLYGAKFRCFVNGSTYSVESQLKFSMNWTGAAGTDWQNAANWNCGIIPDANTDVLIKTAVVNYPVVNNNGSCRSIRVSPGVSVLVKAGVKLTITGRN